MNGDRARWPIGQAARRAARATALGLVLTTSAGCILGVGSPYVIDPPSTTPAPHPSELRAGAAEVDLTPPPGLPMYGYSTNGVKEAVGYWLRLKGRIVVLSQPVAKPPAGEDDDDDDDDAADGAPHSLALPPTETNDALVVLVQADFGASSALVHRGLARRLAGRGVSPANLLYATTHTHGGPGGMFQDRFYNKSVGARPLFVPQYVDFVVDRLAAGVERALDEARPAKIAFGAAVAPESATFNRSLEAWEQNALDRGERPDPSRAVDRTLRLLRVDTLGADGAYHPTAAFSVFAVHGTAMPASYPYYHGDVHGLAARLARGWVEARYGVPDFVSAMATGAEGDVSPGRPDRPQGKELTMDVAAEEARTMERAFASLDAELSDQVRFSFAYSEVSMRGASTSRGRLCDDGVLGASEAAGSEASQGPLNGFLEMVEGAQRGFEGCQARKIKILGGLQDLFYDPSEYPDTVPFQIVSFRRPDGRALLLASFPGEPTTAVGDLVGAEIRRSWPTADVATVGLTNSYATYFTAPSEYMAQHYEGGTTLYGPFQGVFAAEQLGRLAASLTADQPPARVFVPRRVFHPGEAATDAWPSQSCDVRSFEPGEVRFEEVERPSGAPARLVVFEWKGASRDQLCELPTISLECHPAGTRPTDAPRPWRDGRGLVVSDEGFDFEVSRDGDDHWRAAWTAYGAARPDEDCFFVLEDVSRRSSAGVRTAWIASAPFRFPAASAPVPGGRAP